MHLSKSSQNWPEWYQGAGEYSGRGTVYSDELGKLIEGEFSVTWNDHGECRISCSPSNLDMIELLRLSDEFDKFRDLSVSTDMGQFLAKKCYLDGLTLGFPGASGIRFISLVACFVATGIAPVFWNAPVINLVSRFQPQQPIAQHPLRPLQPSSVPAPAHIRLESTIDSDRRPSGFCQFRVGDSAAFIDYLPDYEEKQQRLHNGTSKSEVTCMIVGFLRSNALLDADSILQWFPSDVFALLSFASGTSVGLGLIEIRGSHGQLHSRVHVSSLPGEYVDGPVVVGDFPHGSEDQQSGLGPLISVALIANAEALERVRHLSDAITAAKSELQTPERAFSTIVRALDGISNRLQLNRRHLLQELKGSEPDQIRKVLVDARDAVKQIAQQMTVAGAASSEVATVQRIASRVEQADAIEDSFGLTIPRLLQHYGLHDERAIADCYSARPRFDGLTWPAALNKYRAGVIHKGHIDFSGGVPMSDVVSITKHLVDVASRICLKEIGYLGTYNPFNDAATQVVRIDWITSAEHVELFSLGGKSPSMFRRIGF